VIQGTCHCGNVRIEVSRLPASLVSCNCSICRRLGTLWAYYAPADVTVRYTGEPAAIYVWGDRAIVFHHCRECGCTTHYSSIDNSDEPRLGINCRMLEPSLIDALPVRYIDGASS